VTSVGSPISPNNLNFNNLTIGDEVARRVLAQPPHNSGELGDHEQETKKACFEQVENMTQAWDLDSLLLKPYQRLLKYPLLLQALEDTSDPDHPDRPKIRDTKGRQHYPTDR
jgi:hypothetical protein